MHKLKILFVLLAIFGSFSSVSFARSTENAEKISFNFNNVDIRSVIKSVSKITGKSFIIDPEVNGSVTIVSSEEINTDDVYDIFISILELHGYVTSSEGGLTKIVSATKGKQYVSLDKGGSMGEDPGDQFIVKLYKINYIPADDVISVLRPLTSTNGYLASHKESNMLIMVDRADNIKRIIDIIKRIDQAATGETELIHLQHASAANIVAVIESLEKNQPANTRTNLRLIADERSNGILISGDPANVLRVKALIAKLDAPVENEGSTQVIFLHYARAKDLLPILVGLASGTSSGANQGGAKQNTVSIQADEGSNALIITANPAKMKSMQSVLRALDIRRAQLMIEAIIAEVSTDNASELGVQWRSTDEVGASNKAVVGGTNFSANGSGINQLSSNPLGVGDGLSVGFFNGTTKILGSSIINLGVLLRALSQAGDTNILSTPSLMTMDNEEAEIVIGQNVPFPTGSYTSTGSTTSAVNPFTTYERHDVGIKLKVKPQIIEGATIRLDITQEVSNVASFDQNAGPTTNTRSIKTSVIVDDGKLLVLGGLISDDVQEMSQKVPILGSIPLLGMLFRYDSSKRIKRNLMIFLRPVIVPGGDSSNKITFDKYDYIRGQQLNSKETQIPLIPAGEVPVLPVLETEN